jgi:MFS family permease
MNFLIVSFLAVLSQFMTFATVYGFTPVLAKEMGASSLGLGLLTSLSTLPGIFASALSGTFFARKFGERRTIIAGFTVAALSCVVIPYTKSMAMLYITQFIGGFGWGTVFPLLMGLSIKTVSSEKRATAMGFQVTGKC